MAKKNNPTGLSTGQGKGAAQVFGNTYNPYFKERLTEAKKKDKEVTDAIAKASDASQLWSRDVGAFKPMVNDLQSFYRDNARAIIKGDFDATLKLKQMQNEMSQYVASSKDSQKYANEMLKLVNKPGSNYTDESRQKVFDFVSQAQAGNFDTSGLILNEKYNAADALAAMQKEVTSIGYTAFKPEVNADGIIVNRLAQSEDAVDGIVDKYVANEIQRIGLEAEKYYTPQAIADLKAQLKSTLGEKQTAQTRRDPYTPNRTQGKQDLINEATRRRKQIATFLFGTPAQVRSEAGSIMDTINKNAQQGDKRITSVDVLQPGEEGAVNRMIQFTLSNGLKKSFDTTEDSFEFNMNRYVSGMSGMTSLTDAEYLEGEEAYTDKNGKIIYTPEGGAETEVNKPTRFGNQSNKDAVTTLGFIKKSLGLGKNQVSDDFFYDFAEKIKEDQGLYKNFIDLGLSPLKSNIPSRLDFKEKNAAASFSQAYTALFKGQQLGNSEISKVDIEIPGSGSDKMIITLKDGTTRTIETDSDDFKKIIDGTYFNQQGTQNNKPEVQTVLQNWLKKNKLKDTKENRATALKAYENYLKGKKN